MDNDNFVGMVNNLKLYADMKAEQNRLMDFIKNLSARLEADPNDGFQTRLDKDLLEQLETLLKQ